MKVIPQDWLEHLVPDYAWLVHITKDTDSCKVVTTILEREDYSDGEFVDAYNDTVWGLCHAFLDFKTSTQTITPKELAYLANRGGCIIALDSKKNGKQYYTLRDFLFDLDPSFSDYLLT